MHGIDIQVVHKVVVFFVYSGVWPTVPGDTSNKHDLSLTFQRKAYTARPCTWGRGGG